MTCLWFVDGLSKKEYQHWCWQGTCVCFVCVCFVCLLCMCCVCGMCDVFVTGYLDGEFIISNDDKSTMYICCMCVSCVICI